MVAQVFRQLLRHALGQCRYQHALILLDAFDDFRHQVVHLAAGGAHDDLRVDQAGRAHDLLDHLVGMRFFVVGRGGRDEDRLTHLLFELLEFQGPVVERRRQAEAIVDQVGLARTVAVVHGAQLARQHVRLVEEHQRVGGQIVDQGGRRFARQRAGQVARIVFDALGETDFGHHFQVKARALFQPLFFDQLVFLAEELETLAQFVLDGLDGAQHGGAGRHIVRTRVHGEAGDFLPHAARQRVEQLDRFDLVVEHFQAHGQFRMLGGEDVDGIAAHAEGAAAEVDLVARVLHLDQARDDVALADSVFYAQRQNHLVVFVRVTDTVDGRDGGDDDDVAPLHQRLGARQTHLLDMFVDRRVLFDEQVALRHVGFGLVVIVVADEVFDRILREKVAELAVQLRRQRLVGREDDGRPAHARDDVGHGVGLARTGHAQQGLEGQSIGNPLG